MKLQDFFRGRYGMDAINYVLFFLSILLINMKYVWILGLGSAGYAVFRSFSKNIGKRQLELQKFDKATKKYREAIMLGTRKLVGKSSAYRTRLQQRKDFVFLSCPKCKKTLRLPRNKGKLQVTCPVCKNEFLKKT